MCNMGKERQVTDMSRPWLRSRKAPCYNTSLLSVKTKVLITAITRIRVGVPSAVAGVLVMAQMLAYGILQAMVLRETQVITLAVVSVINQSNFFGAPVRFVGG